MRRAALALILLVSVGCHKNLTGPSLTVARANDAVVAIGTAQHVAIELNKVAVCDTQTPPVCHPRLSDANTRVVVEEATDSLTTLNVVQDGWRAVALAALDRIEMRLDAAGFSSLKPWLDAARTVIGAP